MSAVLRGLFVTGTDTGVGKTVVSAALVERYRAHVRLRYWKPIQTGIEQDDDTAEVARLAGCRPVELRMTGIRLPRPVSPHLAARLSGTTINLGTLLDSFAAEADSCAWIVEGAGGVLVPVNDSESMADLMRRLHLPVVVAARSTLGTINHTLLTLEALRRRDLRVAGVVMVGAPNPENRAAVERHGNVDVVGEMPCFGSLDRAALSSWVRSGLDVESRLLEWLR
jgi:dethiobiotin synthase